VIILQSNSISPVLTIQNKIINDKVHMRSLILIVATGVTTGTAKKYFKFRRVATIVYYGKLQKNQKSDLRTKLKSGSRLRVGKVLAPYNARPRTVPLIE